MIRREFSAERLNEIVNHPDVRPFVAQGDHRLDLTPMVAHPRNVLLLGDGGGQFYVELGDGVYEAHTMFLPEHRGAEAIAVTRETLAWMFTRTDATSLVTKVPEHNSGARALVQAIHGTRFFSRDKAWGERTVDYYALPLDRWAGLSADCIHLGEWFHEKLEAAKLAAGRGDTVHPEDKARDRYVGATIAMVQHGQLRKAMDFYSRWSRFAGYGPVAVIAENPTVIDIGDAIIAVRGEDFDVLLVR